MKLVKKQTKLKISRSCRRRWQQQSLKEQLELDHLRLKGILCLSLINSVSFDKILKDPYFAM